MKRPTCFALDMDSMVGPRCRAASDDRPVVPTLIFNRTITLRDTWAKEAQKV
jgi:hypothetical protein